MYIPHSFALTEAQKKRISKFQSSNEASLDLKLAPRNLIGDDVINVTKTIKSQINKAIIAKKGVTIKLSRAMMKQQKGGLLGQALSILQPIQGFASQLISPGFEERMARYIGSGVPSEQADIIKLFMKHKGKIFKPEIQKQYEMVGGGAFQDALNGFLYGFTNPIGGIKAVIKSLGGGTKRLGAGSKTLGSGSKMLGSGIQFF